MKAFSRIIITAFLVLSLLPANVSAAGTGEAVYTRSVALADGFQYINRVSYNAGGSRVASYSVSLAPAGQVRPIVVACDTIYGGMTIDRIVSYGQSLGYNVVGAMNADFGYWSTRIPCGVVVEDGIYKTSPEQCNALAFTDSGAFISPLPEVNIALSVDDQTVNLVHYNKTRADNGGLYLYSEYFSTVSTRTSTDGWAVRLKVLEGRMSVSGTLKLQVEGLYEGKDASPIGEGYLILTAAAASDMRSVFELFQVGDTVTLTTSCSDEKLTGARWVTGCGNILLSGGEIYSPDGWDSSIGGYHPRSCVGIKPDGTLIFRVVDGRSGDSGGATMMQLAEDFLAMGCTDAVNLDGGGSSAISMRLPGDSSAVLQNAPSDGTLRSCPSYILFVTDAVSDGVASRLFLKEDGAVLLAGSSLPLHFLATDAGLYSTAAPGDAQAQSAGGLGSVLNGVYPAGAKAGPAAISLSSAATGITGAATVHVITKADTLSVTDADKGSAVSRIYLDEGKTLQFAVSARYLRKNVVMDRDAVRYAVTGDIGSVTEDGLFKASQTWGAEGTITVSAAGLQQSIPVRIGAVFDDIGGHWARAFIEKLYGKGVVNGTTATSYSPDADMKRGDFLLMLHRAAGKPAVSADPAAEAGAAAFTDVPEGAYYASAIAWAQAKGIAQGTGDGRFLPEATLSREQAFTFVYRALPILGVGVSDNETLPKVFSDALELSSWAAAPTASLVDMGLVVGSDGKLNPKGLLTRAQMAKILSMAVYG
jgi:hypothetical protein